MVYFVNIVENGKDTKSTATTIPLGADEKRWENSVVRARESGFLAALRCCLVRPRAACAQKCVGGGGAIAEAENKRSMMAGDWNTASALLRWCGGGGGGAS
ncbi:Hypothetical predicted protein [Cloeon dipterum]|uniref:Uncharacterized protein n=1 Tax=Cloeon dipterum TaxID=197152 RepID=A0A8S1C582_9INSE|nr:Hypothetical predicted protein [Cloeon dipterum]